MRPLVPALALTLLAAAAAAEPVATHLDQVRDRAAALRAPFDENPLFPFTKKQRKQGRAAIKVLKAHRAASTDLKGDLGIVARIAKQADKLVKLDAEPLPEFDVAASFEAALSLYESDVQAAVDDAASRIVTLPESQLAERADEARAKAQKKLDKTSRVFTLLARAKALTQACKKLAKAEELYAKAREKSPRHPCVDRGTPHGEMTFLFLDRDENQVGPVHEMEDVDAILIAANALGDGFLNVTGTIADNPFFDGTSFDPFEIALIFRNPELGPYPKTIEVDGPLNGRPQASAMWREDGSRFSDARNYGTGTITLTSYDPVERQASGFFDVVVDDFLDVPRRISGSFQLDCFVDNEVDNR